MDNAASSSQPTSPAQALLAQELAHIARLQAERDANPDPGRRLATRGVVAGPALAPDVRGSCRAEPLRRCDAVLSERTCTAATTSPGAMPISRESFPMMVRMLPERVLLIVAKAVELHALSQDLDRSLLARLPRADGQFSVAEYCKAYARMGKRAERERQIRLIGEIGGGIAEFVRKPFLLHGPADDAATGAAVGAFDAARFPRARFHRVPENGRRDRIPHDDRHPRARVDGGAAGRRTRSRFPIRWNRVASG